MQASIICTNRAWGDPASPMRAVAAGLERIGLFVKPAIPGQWPIFSKLPDAAFIWNGVRGNSGLIADELRRHGVAAMVMERGFFDRFNRTQIDHSGFNHTASWVGKLCGPAPVEGVGRFGELIDTIGPPRPTGPRGRGYVLILGQVAGDTQLQDSEIRCAEDLVNAVESAVGGDVELRFRAHPRDNWRCWRLKAPDGDLTSAIDGARFAITVNSNSANDALVRGCPVLCMGPSLPGIAGVAIQTSLISLRRNIELMLAGWSPDSRRVLSYLHWLAARQWTIDELADAEGGPLRSLLSDAGLKLE